MKILTRKNALVSLIITLTILLIPFFGTIFSSEVNWNIFDFLLAFGMLFLFIILTILILKKIKTSRMKAVVIVLLFILLLMIWAELAVGLFGTLFSGK